MPQKFKNPQYANINIFLGNINFIFRPKFTPMPTALCLYNFMEMYCNVKLYIAIYRLTHLYLDQSEI